MRPSTQAEARNIVNAKLGNEVYLVNFDLGPYHEWFDFKEASANGEPWDDFPEQGQQ